MPFAPDNKHIIVNYHYIRERSEKYSGIHPCAPEEFERQVKFLSSQFRIATVKEVFDAAKQEIKDRLCALTFDDGFRDNFEHALPVLEKYQAKGIFFPVAKVFQGLLPTTHKVHVVLSKFSVPDLVRRFNRFLMEHAPRLAETYQIPSDRRITTERKIFDDVLTANFKEMMSIVPQELKRRFLDALFVEADLRDSALVEEFFMGEREVKELLARGHEIGSHGLTHDALDCLSEKEIEREVFDAKRIIGEISGSEPTVFSYPQSAPSKDIFNILERAGFTHAVIVNTIRGVEKDDHPLMIPRYDTNDIRDYLKNHAS
ncbi:MAG: polysaccharide deacetylase family protein [Patescibacteria group bacterium]